MESGYMLRKHQATMEAAGKPEAVAERKRYGEACVRARKDRATRFPNITPDNFEEAAAYQEQRIAHWLRVLSY